MSIESVRPSNHLILCCPLLFCLQSFPASGFFPMSWLCIGWPKYWHFSFSNSPSIEYSGLISFRIDWFVAVVQPFSHVSLWPHRRQHARFPCPWLYPGVCSNSCPLSRWCHPIISCCVISFSFPQSFPASASFPMSQLFASGGQSIGVSALASVLPMNIQGWFPILQHSAFFMEQLGHPYVTTGNFVSKVINSHGKDIVVYDGLSSAP